MAAILYLIAYIWALATSGEPWKTLLWMGVSLASYVLNLKQKDFNISGSLQ
jgi:hypothetical protein